MRPHNRQFQAIGSSWQVDTDRSLSAAEWSAVYSRIEDFDRTYSRFRADSLVSRLAAEAGTVEFPPDAVPLLAFYRQLYDLTAGAVTPLVGGALDDLGYDATYRLTPRDAVRATPEWDAVMVWDGPVVSTSQPVSLDFGAAGKGCLVDLIAGLLTSFEVASYVVDGSGDLLHHGPDVLRVGLEHPGDPTKVIGVAPLRNAGLAASAGNRRAWGNGLHHIIDPRSGRPVADVRATWAIADSAMVADGLATALFVAEPAVVSELVHAHRASWVRLSASGSAQRSTDFEGELFT